MAENRNKWLVKPIDSASEISGSRERDNAHPDPTYQQPMRGREMLMNPDNIEAPLVQAEPPQWHVYRALALYRDEHKARCSNIYFQRKLDAAHDAYLNTFVGG